MVFIFYIILKIFSLIYHIINRTVTEDVLQLRRFSLPHVVDHLIHSLSVLFIIRLFNPKIILQVTTDLLWGNQSLKKYCIS